MPRHDDLPVRQSMKRAHRVRRFRRSNEEHGARGYLGTRRKPWKNPHYTLRSVA